MTRIMDGQQATKSQIPASSVTVLLHEHYDIISVHLFFLHPVQARDHCPILIQSWLKYFTPQILSW